MERESLCVILSQSFVSLIHLILLLGFRDLNSESLITPTFRRSCVTDSFDFASSIRGCDLTDLTMDSFDITSLFTNVPIRETLEIIRKLIVKHCIDLPISVEVLCDLISLCTEHVQFSFDECFYFQEDGIAMGSPLGPILSNIFIGYFEHHALHDSIRDLTVRYSRFADDTFVLVRSRENVDEFLSILNSIHPNLSFTCEFQSERGDLPFLDVLVGRDECGKAITSVYHKPTWTGLYLNFHSFVPLRYKSGLVRTLFNRADKICSVSTLSTERDLLFNVLKENGYPSDFIVKHSRPPSPKTPNFGPECKDVYLKIPFTGDALSSSICKRVFQSVKDAFPAANPRFVFATRRIPIRPLKDSVAALGKSHVVYKFCCDCGSSYVGRTERRVTTRIKEHLPRWIHTSRKTSTSSICKHVIDCEHFTGKHFSSYFSILASCPFSFSLRILESLFIRRRKPPLCVQKEFVYSLSLPW
ncbi:MAG: reverse transcriptase domain-containing protein [Pseudomonadota bacterium]